MAVNFEKLVNIDLLSRFLNKIKALIPSKVSDLTNDSGFVNTTGAANAAPVQSVNGQTGAVILDAPVVQSGTGTNSILHVNAANPNTASGNDSVALGNQSIASGHGAIAAGLYVTNQEYGCQATSDGAVAMGGSTTASNAYATAIGYKAKASGTASVALGYNNEAQGSGAFAIGQNSVAKGNRASAIGLGLIASGNNSLVAGKYNQADETNGTSNNTYGFIIGNGSSSVRSNALTVDWNGNVEASGKMTVGTAPTADMDVATKKYVDDGLSEKGTYSKPSTGIPKTDLDSAVQTSLGLADTALQSYTETDPTVPSWAKASNKPSYTASEVGAAPAVTEVTISTAGAVTQALDPGKLYHFTGALSALTITFNAAGTGVIAQYHFDFDSGSTAPTVTLPNGVTMQGGTFAPEASKHYEVDILNNYGVSMAW